MKSYMYSMWGYLLYLLPVLLSNVLYKDDISRVLENSGRSWIQDGRPFMALLHYILNFGTAIFNLSPLTQIIGAGVLGYAAYRFVEKYITEYPIDLKVLCIISVLINPFFLENLSYNFESLGMCTALACAIGIYLPEGSLRKTILVTVLGTFIVMGTYQAAVGGIIIGAMIVSYLKHDIKMFLIRIGGILGGVLIYMLTIAKFLVPSDGYQGEHSALVTSVDMFLKHYGIYMQQLKDLFFPNIDAPVTCLFTFVILGCICGLISYMYTIDLKDRWVAVLPFVSVFVSFLPLCFLEKTIYMPRTMISFNMVFLFCAILLSQLIIKAPFMRWLPAFMVLWCYTFSYTLGNILISQDRLENHVMSDIATDIGRLNINKDTKIYITGNRIICLEAQAAEQKHKVFHVLNNTRIRTDVTYIESLLSHYMNRKVSVRIDVPKAEYKIMAINNSYLLVGDKDHVIIVLR